ncbi:YheE family protein [Mesobacillus maritimus]|uniref:YheE family protein n=1 Tax=Mesobacillus maritimus TaxID=1643336 RepID=UPI00203F8137|nr:YheE family protein [Mesobacillus maritimus]MCM3586040.1 YheE family protein [Mesobacillus maritimus]MCM3671728.1 YheE family protein [Mesobacillus maritimus]
MFTHFQIKPLYENTDIPGWRFSFYYLKQKYSGIYHQNGQIEWKDIQPTDEQQQKLESQIHELMLFHVYDK